MLVSPTNRLLVVSLQSRPSLAMLGVREIGGDIVPLAAGGTIISYDIAPNGRILVTEPVAESFSVVLVRNWLADLR